MNPVPSPTADSTLELRPEHIGDFNRLVKRLRFGPPFQLLLIEFGDTRYRDFLIAELDEVLAKEGLATARMELTPSSHPDFAAAENDWAGLAANHQALHVLGGDTWFNQERMEFINIRREAVARRVPLRLMLWLNVKQVNAMPNVAPDLWSWRSGVFSFIARTAPSADPPIPQMVVNDHAPWTNDKNGLPYYAGISPNSHLPPTIFACLCSMNWLVC